MYQLYVCMHILQSILEIINACSFTVCCNYCLFNNNFIILLLGTSSTVIIGAVSKGLFYNVIQCSGHSIIIVTRTSTNTVFSSLSVLSIIIITVYFQYYSFIRN